MPMNQAAVPTTNNNITTGSSASSDHAENRDNRRIRALKSARLQFESSSFGVDCVVRDINPTGAKVRLEAESSVDTVNAIFFKTENKIVPARVVWQEGQSVGLRFKTKIDWIAQHY